MYKRQILLSVAYVKLVGVKTPEEFRHKSAAQQRKYSSFKALSPYAVSYTHLLHSPGYFFAALNASLTNSAEPTGNMVLSIPSGKTKCVQCLYTVSYTHLDVYKRQGHIVSLHIYIQPGPFRKPFQLFNSGRQISQFEPFGKWFHIMSSCL